MKQLQRAEEPKNQPSNVLLLKQMMVDPDGALLAAFKQNEPQMRKEMGYALMAIQDSPALQKCTKESMIKSAFLVGRSGLTLNPLMNQSDLIPRYKNNNYECCWEPRYQGLITKMVSIGVVRKVISCEPIYENDIFEADFVDMTITKYVPHYMRLDLPKSDDGRSNHGREVGAFVKALLSNGEQYLLIRGIDYINDICEKSESVKSWRKKSKADQAKLSVPLWLSEAWRPQMIRKTMIKLLWGQIPKPENENLDQMAEIIEVDNAADPVITDARVPGQEVLEVSTAKQELKKAAAEPELADLPDGAGIGDLLEIALPILGPPKRTATTVKKWINKYWLPVMGLSMEELEIYFTSIKGASKADSVVLPLLTLELDRVASMIQHIFDAKVKAETVNPKTEDVDHVDVDADSDELPEDGAAEDGM